MPLVLLHFFFLLERQRKRGREWGREILYIFHLPSRFPNLTTARTESGLPGMQSGSPTWLAKTQIAVGFLIFFLFFFLSVFFHVIIIREEDMGYCPNTILCCKLILRIYLWYFFFKYLWLPADHECDPFVYD